MSSDKLILGLFLLALAVLDVALLERARSSSLAAQSMLLFTMASAQTALAVVWLLLGSGPVVLRGAACAVAFLACQHAFAGHDLLGVPYALFLEADFDNLTFALALTFFLMAQQLWIRWRGSRATSHERLPRAGRQFAIIDLLMLVTAVAIGLTAWRYYRLHQYTPAMNSYFLPARVAVALAVIWTALGRTNPLRRVAAPYGLAIAAGVTMVALGRLPRDMAWYPVTQLTLDATALLACLLVLRVVGIRLTRQSDPRSNTAVSADHWLAVGSAVREPTL